MHSSRSATTNPSFASATPLRKRPVDPLRNRLLPALLATGACGLAAAPAAALQLGDIEVQSALGQPLRASIAYALSPNEQLSDYCIFLRPNPAAGVPTVNTARLTVSGGRINITGGAPLMEPIVALGLAVECPYTPKLTRSYTLMLDPVARLEAEPVSPRRAAAPAPAAEPGVETTPRRAEVTRAAEARPAESPAAPSSSIAPSTRYRVRFGDTLSTIVSRIENRPIGLWPAVERVFAANPDAFIDGDMNRLKAGTVLEIPSFDGSAAPALAAVAVPVGAANATVAATDENTSAGADAVQAGESSGAGVEPAVYAGAESAAETSSGAAESIAARIEAEPSASDSVSTERPAVIDARGAVERTVLDTEIPLETPATTDVDGSVAGTPPAAIADPAAAEAETRAARPVAETAAAPPASGTLLYWIFGAAALLAAGLFGYSRRSQRQSPPPLAPANADAAKSSGEKTLEDLPPPGVDYDVDELDAVPSGARLDFDLGAGTGMRRSDDVELMQDFAFSTSRDLGADLDVVLPASADSAGDSTPTDVLPAHRAEKHTILEKEILPTDDDDDEDDDNYDLSMIVDATRQRFADADVTTKDLQAVPLDASEADAGRDDEYTLSNEIDYDILEQDYEDELSATQALNAELLKAGEDLESRLTGDETVEMAAPAAENSIADDEDTGVNEQLTEELATVDGDATRDITNGEIESHRLEDTGATTELTAELPSAVNDDTADLEVESGHFRARKSAG